MIQKFVIEGRLEDVNSYTRANRAHFQKGARMKREQQEIVEWEIKKSHLKPVNGRVFIEYRFYERAAANGQMRDPDNISGFAHKVINDALQTCGIIENDDLAHIAGMADVFRRVKRNGTGKNRPRIEVYIESE